MHLLTFRPHRSNLKAHLAFQSSLSFHGIEFEHAFVFLSSLFIEMPGRLRPLSSSYLGVDPQEIVNLR